ncbi:unnamed protein product [Lactuca saligna]|uniref:HMA domain-containing protein n=1 Tax=Lactuca saligna TaxID=75948 RepID=A0AA35VWJ8_LACSI|nr:unnamed protein product [Lactuca saligna]
MAKKKNRNNDNNDNNNNNHNNSTNNENDDNGEKKQKASGIVVVVLKMDLHCEGCAGRIVKAVRSLDGVESVRIGDSELNKLTVIGNLDPAKLRQKVHEKTKKKVELISPATKKNNDGENNNNRSDGGDGDNKKKQQKSSSENQQPPSDKAKNAVKKDEKKPKELSVTTAVLKVPLHCQGCVRKIHKIISKTKGFIEMSIDKNKDLVTVKGATDMKMLAEVLKQKLKKAVEIVPAKKDGGDEKKGKGGGGNDGEEKGGGGQKKGKKGGGGDDGHGNDGTGGKMEAYKMESFGGPYPHFEYGSGYADYVHAPQLFSDENPNACSVM